MKELQEKGLEMLGIYHSHLDNQILKSFRISAVRVEPEHVEYL